MAESESRAASAQAGAGRVALALQGGGAHGAFTWGVLDRLLDQPDLEIGAISGTSAGAINGALLACGLAAGGPAAARAALARFWQRTAHLSALSPLQPTALDRMVGNGRLDWSPAYWWLDFCSRVFSPYDYNAADFNPVREALAGCVDAELLADPDRPGPRLFVSATHVRSGRLKLFRDAEVTREALLASCCLPYLNRAVEIDGQAYWDGGYLGNPAILPLYAETGCRDLVLVQVTPTDIDHAPMSAQAIFDRMTTLTFNAGMLRELETLAHLSRQAGDPVRLHRIHADGELRGLDASSRLNADQGFLDRLFALGRAAAEDWLTEHAGALGRAGTFQPDGMYL